MRYIYFSIIILLSVSCSESKMLQKSLAKYQMPIGYLHDSQTINYPASDSLFVRLNNEPLDSITSVSKIKALFLPFIVFNYYEINMKVNLGQNSFQQPYSEFFKGSLIEESKRTAYFGITDRVANDSVYTLDITIDSCSTISKYRRTSSVMYLLIAYSYGFSESGYPAETNMKVSAKLSKGGRLIYQKNYRIKNDQPFLNPRNPNNIRRDFVANMVESLSLSTKQCIEDIIFDVNSAIRN